MKNLKAIIYPAIVVKVTYTLFLFETEQTKIFGIGREDRGREQNRHDGGSERDEDGQTPPGGKVSTSIAPIYINYVYKFNRFIAQLYGYKYVF